MKLSAKQAGDEVGYTKQAILKAIKDGRISAEKVNGEWQIEPAELFRVYTPINKVGNKVSDNQFIEVDNGIQSSLHLKNKELELEFNAINREKELYQSQLADTKRQLEDSKEDRDHWRNQAEKLLLTAHVSDNGKVKESAPPVPEPTTPPLVTKKKFDLYWPLIFIMVLLGAGLCYMIYFYAQAPDAAVDLIDKILSHRFNPF